MSAQWFFVPVNPYPWKVPPMTVGRKGKALFVRAGRDEGLHTFKQAVAEIVGAQNPHLIDGKVKLSLWFWRNIPEYTTTQGRRARKHEADVTNMQKATEDALQGILYLNDVDNIDVHSRLISQGAESYSFLVIRAEQADLVELGDLGFPDTILEQIRLSVDEEYRTQKNPTLFDDYDNEEVF